MHYPVWEVFWEILGLPCHCCIGGYITYACHGSIGDMAQLHLTCDNGHWDEVINADVYKVLKVSVPVGLWGPEKSTFPWHIPQTYYLGVTPQVCDSTPWWHHVQSHWWHKIMVGILPNLFTMMSVLLNMPVLLLPGGGCNRNFTLPLLHMPSTKSHCCYHIFPEKIISWGGLGKCMYSTLQWVS